MKPLPQKQAMGSDWLVWAGVWRSKFANTVHAPTATYLKWKKWNRNQPPL